AGPVVGVKDDRARCGGHRGHAARHPLRARERRPVSGGGHRWRHERSADRRRRRRRRRRSDRSAAAVRPASERRLIRKPRSLARPPHTPDHFRARGWPRKFAGGYGIGTTKVVIEAAGNVATKLKPWI